MKVNIYLIKDGHPAGLISENVEFEVLPRIKDHIRLPKAMPETENRSGFPIDLKVTKVIYRMAHLDADESLGCANIDIYVHKGDWWDRPENPYNFTLKKVE